MDTWLDDFFRSYYRRRPVNATFTGVHDYDDHLPDYSEQGVADVVTEMSGLLERPIIHLDTRLAAGYLRIQLAEFESGWFYRLNPCVYTGEAIFGVIALFLRDFAPLEQRIDAAIGRLHTIPRLLAQGQVNITAAPLEWTRKAIRECQGAREFLTGGIDMLIASAHDRRIINPSGAEPLRLDVSSSRRPMPYPSGAEPLRLDVSSSRRPMPYPSGASSSQLTALRAAADVALAAFAKFETYLTTTLAARPSETYACGQAMFDLLMAEGHCLDLDTEGVRAYADQRFAEIRESLDREAQRLRPDGNGQAILAGLADEHPSADGYLDNFHACWQACYAAASEHELVTWPDFPLQYIEVPPMFRAAAPYLYFLPYRSPPTFDPTEVYHYLVPPMAGLAADEQRARLRATNNSVVKLNHVVHHGSIGHHVQNWYAYRSASRIGQVAAIDGALRIGMFCGGTLAEGWACYVTDLMGEFDFYTPAEAFAQQHSTLRQAARAVGDTNLHLGRFSLDDATDFYVNQVGMAREAARAEAVKNSMFPGAAMMYLLGTDMVHDLRRRVAAQEGASFSLRRFHDRFLSYGAIPVSLIAQDMLRQ